MSKVNGRATGESLIIGAGLSGLACALELEKRDIRCRILEASDAVGGRVRTDIHQGFRLDRGFQILTTAYPEVQRYFDLEALSLQPITKGALVWNGRDIHRLTASTALTSQLLSWGDRLRLARMGAELLARPIDAPLTDKSRVITTRQYLMDRGISELAVKRFFEPFFGGVFLETELSTSASFFRFMMGVFARSTVAIPARGMVEIPRQLSSRLRTTAIELEARVVALGDRTVELEGGRKLRGDAIVIATGHRAARRLMGEGLTPITHKSTATTYFEAEESPIGEPIMCLNGAHSEGPINNVICLSDVSKAYALPGRALIACNTVGIPGEGVGLATRAKLQLEGWFGKQVRSWREIRTYEIPEALPAYDPTNAIERSQPKETIEDWEDWLAVCGDHVSTPSIDGALRSGRLAAERVADYLESGGRLHTLHAA